MNVLVFLLQVLAQTLSIYLLVLLVRVRVVPLSL